MPCHFLFSFLLLAFLLQLHDRGLVLAVNDNAQGNTNQQGPPNGGSNPPGGAPANFPPPVDIPKPDSPLDLPDLPDLPGFPPKPPNSPDPRQPPLPNMPPSMPGPFKPPTGPPPEPANDDSDAGDTEERERELREAEEKDVLNRQVSQRQLNVKADKDTVEIEGKVVTGSVRDTVKFALNSEDFGFRLLFEYKTTDQTQALLRVVVDILELIEYLPTATAHYLPDGNNSVVRRWAIQKSDFAPIASSSTPNGVKQFTASAGNGRLVIRGSISEQDAALGEVKIDPNSMKIDIEVHNWQYSPVHNDSRLALRVAVRSVHAESVDKHTSSLYQRQICFRVPENSPGGRFRWADQVNLTGSVSAPVKASLQQREATSQFRSNFDVYYSFLTPTNNMQAADIVWDPQMGLDYSVLAKKQSGHVGLLVGFVAGSVALFGTAAIAAITLIHRRSIRKRTQAPDEIGQSMLTIA
eukprot:TRINITY_DN7185_c0_g1_i1.p1 TRINITY_DN7185_c0_g1~~TRINITY_DN7185_c0_g1_i1.p1  ORF type:complete len:477 (-),score=65.99 TRINITY_DN7185_c0_g1_i1:213-1613(-)